MIRLQEEEGTPFTAIREGMFVSLITALGFPLVVFFVIAACIIFSTSRRCQRAFGFSNYMVMFAVGGRLLLKKSKPHCCVGVYMK